MGAGGVGGADARFFCSLRCACLAGGAYGFGAGAAAREGTSSSSELAVTCTTTFTGSLCVRACGFRPNASCLPSAAVFAISS